MAKHTTTERRPDRIKPAAGGGTIRVLAFALGVYDDVRRRVGDVFDLHPRTGMFSAVVEDKDGNPKVTKGTLVEHPITEEKEQTLTAEEQFNPKWMEKVDATTPARASSGNEAIASEHDEILRGRLNLNPSPADGRIAQEQAPDRAVRPGQTGESGPTGDADPLGGTTRHD